MDSQLTNWLNERGFDTSKLNNLNAAQANILNTELIPAWHGLQQQQSLAQNNYSNEIKTQILGAQQTRAQAQQSIASRGILGGGVGNLLNSINQQSTGRIQTIGAQYGLQQQQINSNELSLVDQFNKLTMGTTS